MLNFDKPYEGLEGEGQYERERECEAEPCDRCNGKGWRVQGLKCAKCSGTGLAA